MAKFCHSAQNPAGLAEENTEIILMARTVTVIGIQPEELVWIRLLVPLLRHPDPVVPELVRQALLYLEAAAAKSPQANAIAVDSPE